MQPSKFNAGGAALIALAIALSACGKTNTPAGTPPGVAQTTNISGDYCIPAGGCSATWQDSKYGTATGVSATLAQHGSSAGGAMTGTFGAAVITAQLALTITASNTVAGTMVIDFPNQGIFANQTCTFSTTGTYSNAGTSPTLSGSYSAVTGCSGDSGTFALTQSCINTIAVAGGRRRPMSLPAQC